MKCADRICWVLGLVVALNLAACSPSVPVQGPSIPAPDRAAGEEDLQRIVILGTNDIHGGIESHTLKDGTEAGGLSQWAGIVRAIRAGVARASQGRDAVVLVDAGDQFQGTMISNMSEGLLTIQAMNVVGYDAVITGNHDYDFGPIGWLEDQVTPQSADTDPRGALRKVVAEAQFPFVSANTYMKSSLVDVQGAPIAVDGIGCRPLNPKAVIDWSRAEGPDFLRPYLIKEVAGLRIALIGLDNPGTPSTTTPANVTDLCFADEVSSYLRVRRELNGKADVFVIVAHDGMTDSEVAFKESVAKILDAPGPWVGGVVDAVIAGHTHYLNKAFVSGVPIIQSRSGGEMFGRIDLYWSAKHHSVFRKKTRAWAGVSINGSRCAPSAVEFCRKDEATGQLLYEGEPAQRDASLDALIQRAREEVAPLANRVLGHAEAKVDVDRTQESALANALTDTFRMLSGADVAFMNTGGIRKPLDAGTITYEELFGVLPFNNHGVVVAPMSRETFMSLLRRSVQTCGMYGALMQSGFRVSFDRNCQGSGTVDSNARIRSIDWADGRPYWREQVGYAADAPLELQAATLDFLAAGGAGYVDFKFVPVIRDHGIIREAMTEYFLEHPATLSGQVDRRWVQLPRPQSTPSIEGLGSLLWTLNPGMY